MGWKKLYIKPNKAAQKAAKRGLEARRKAPKSKRGGLDAIQASVEGVGSGVLRARDIVAGKRVNAYQVNAFFNRHRNNYLNARVDGLKPEESRAIQAWLLWGGEPLRKQAAAAVRKDKAKRNPSIDRSGMISYGEYYGLPDGDGGYDLYYKDRLIASGVQTVREAEEEITRHADLA